MPATKSKIIDVHSNNSYKWTQTQDEDTISKIPYVTLIEYENLTDLLYQRLTYLKAYDVNSQNMNPSGSDFKQVYADLYKAIPTGYVYKLPYLGKYPFGVTTSYKQIDVSDTTTFGEEVALIMTNISNSAFKLGDELDAIKQLTSTRRVGDVIDELYDPNNEKYAAGRQRRRGTAVGKQTIKSYESGDTTQFETTFSLINDTEEQGVSNYALIQRLMMSLLPSYPNLMTVQCPYLYEIDIPSCIHIPLGFIGNFSATPMGTSYLTSDKIIIPNAWSVHLTFNSLFPASIQQHKTMLDSIPNTKLQIKTKNEDMNTDNRFFTITNEAATQYSVQTQRNDYIKSGD